MRLTLALVLLGGCATPKVYETKGIVLAAQPNELLDLRLQRRPGGCKNFSGPMVPGGFAWEMRIACSRLGSEMFVEVTPSLGPMVDPTRAPILSGGTYGAEDYDEAREQTRSCGASSGWVTPAPD